MFVKLVIIIAIAMFVTIYYSQFVHRFEYANQSKPLKTFENKRIVD